jgi:hypothetical protein
MFFFRARFGGEIRILDEAENDVAMFMENKTDNVTLRSVRELFLQWKSNKYYIFVSVCPGVWACACMCVNVALLIQHATRICHIFTSFVVTRAPPSFSILSHKRHHFRKNLLNTNCGFGFLCNICLKHLSF